MSNPPPNLEPTPVLPLSYYDGQSGPWMPALRFTSWVVIVCAGIVIVTQGATIGTWALQVFSPGRRFTSGYLYYVLLIAFPALPAAVLLAGGIRSLRLLRSGRTLIVWASAALCVCSLLSSVVTIVMYSTNRFLWNNWTIAVSTIMSSLSEMLFRGFVPVLLWIIFRRREVREMFERA
jgi:hypothetical protein